jgi:TolB-like protein/Tfp pilus assembly protein PilF
VFDLTSGFLLHKGQEVKLRPKVFDALRYLIENSGRLVAKAELIQAVWSDSFVTDDSLVQCIVELRRALGDDSQQLIRTVPRRGYTFIADVREVRGEKLVSAEETQAINSIAVLPLENTTGDPEMEYLSDGISESLIDDLSQLPGVKVIARSSSFKYKGKDADPQSVARELRVQAVVSGRVTQRGDQLQIRAELINASDSAQLWGEQYSRGSLDLLSVQLEMSRQIADKLRLRLTSVERRQLARHDTANPQAYELLLRGRFYRNKGGTENLKKAVRYYEQAIDTDPNYALAHAELSTRYSSLVAAGFLDPGDYLPKAEAEARRALELDPGLADAHFALAGIILMTWDWSAAEREYQWAIKSNPNLAIAHGGYAHFLSLMGRHEQAIEAIKRARELDPLSVPVNVGVGFMLYLARQYDQSIAVLNEVLELDQNYSFAHLYLGYNYAAKAMHEAAIAAFREAIKRGDNTLSAQVYLGVAYAKAEQRKKARAILKSLQASDEFVSPCKLAILYDSLGEREQAFSSLERAYDAHDFQLAQLRVEPAFDSLRQDKRFAHLLRLVGLN